MSFNILHYTTLGVIALIFIAGIIAALKQENKKLVLPMILSTTLICMLLAGIGIAVVEKYTKKVKLIKVQNKRYLTQEKISYYGFIKNVGKYTIGKVTVDIKLVNSGHATGNVKPGAFYKASGFLNFFTSGANVLYKPQTIEKKFVVAKNVKPGEVLPFRVTFDYPPYFKNTSNFIKVYGH